jgi:hypothetical protein
MKFKLTLPYILSYYFKLAIKKHTQKVNIIGLSTFHYFAGVAIIHLSEFVTPMLIVLEYGEVDG